MRSPTPAVLAVLAALLVLAPAAPASSAIGYEASAGFGPVPEIYIFHGYDFAPQSADTGDFGFGGGLCPAPGTPNFLCARGRGASGINGGRIFLKAAARVKRTDASADVRETAAYGGARVTMNELGGVAANTVTSAAFYFRLDGTLVKTGANPNLNVNATAHALLSAGENNFFQCFSDQPCTNGNVVTVKTRNWAPRLGFVLDLRVDAGLYAAAGFSGWSGEASADFFTTMELLAITVLDENDQPLPDVHLFLTDENGDLVAEIPNTPPDPNATATPTPVASATPTVTASSTPAAPTPTATPACANPPCEDCANCVDDDGDQLVDGADVLDCPAADGAGAGLAAPRGKGALKCQKAIAKAGAKLAAQRVSHLGKCLVGGFVCAQEKPVDACWQKAAAGCDKELAAIAKDEAKLAATTRKACGRKSPDAPPILLVEELRDATGLGYATAATSCQALGVPFLDGEGAIAECLARQHACRVDAALGAAVPRAADLLTRAGRDPSALPCLGVATTGGADGLGDPKARVKAASACQSALAGAGQKYVKTTLGAVQQCALAVYACVQRDPADAACIAKARATCAKTAPTLAGADGVAARYAAAVGKACGVPALAPADLTAPLGLGFAADAAECAALGVAPLDGPTAVATCVERGLACRTRLLLDLEVPRWRELLGIGQSAAP